MIRALPRRISLSPPFDRHRVFNGQMSHVINWIRIVGPQAVQIGVKCSDRWPDTGANVRRGVK